MGAAAQCHELFETLRLYNISSCSKISQLLQIVAIQTIFFLNHTYTQLRPFQTRRRLRVLEAVVMALPDSRSSIHYTSLCFAMQYILHF